MTWFNREITEMEGRALHPETLMMGYGYFPGLSEGAVKCPIFQTSTFVFRSAQEGKRFFELAYGLRQPAPAEAPGLIYSRLNNPNLEILEGRLAVWDQAERALAFSSGMAAISTCLFACCRPGDVVVHSTPVYGGSDYLLERILPQFGIQTVGFRAGHGNGPLREAIDRAAGLGRIAALFVETPANPTNGLVDLEACARAADGLVARQGSRPLVVVDNTFLGPLWQKPLKHGCDVAVYSLTKYVGGHSDVVAGACVGSGQTLEPIHLMRTILGTMTDPHTAWLLMRSLETLELRFTRSVDNARRVAEFLRDHPAVESVQYLGFLDPASEEGQLYARQCIAPGATFSFCVKGGEAEAFQVLDALQLVKLAVSLGGTESLASHPAAMTHSDIEAARRAEIGITENMIRISIGIEHPDDLIADFRQALATLVLS
ncbi:MAG: cystathionine gamma-synthase family protein [Steroidobacteraceae bacterium]